MRWRPEDRLRAQAMRASGTTFKEIAATFPGRNDQQVHHALSPKRNIRITLGPITREILSSLDNGLVRPPVYLIEEAVMRALAPRTTTMWFLGDPVLNQHAGYLTPQGRRRITI